MLEFISCSTVLNQVEDTKNTNFTNRSLTFDQYDKKIEKYIKLCHGTIHKTYKMPPNKKLPEKTCPVSCSSLSSIPTSAVRFFTVIRG